MVAKRAVEIGEMQVGYPIISDDWILHIVTAVQKEGTKADKCLGEESLWAERGPIRSRSARNINHEA
jgi:hypothetical protein